MAEVTITFSAAGQPARLTKWRVSLNTMVSAGRVVLLYRDVGSETNTSKNCEKKLRASKFGRVTKILAKEGDVLQPGQVVLLMEGCKHPTVMKDLCAECGADLREEFARADGQQTPVSQASVPMVHCIPELKVCPELAEKIGREDERRLLRDSKLALLVDLDQTLVHTTNDNVPPDMKDVYHFQLYGPHSPWYHTKLRPGTRHFLSEMSRLYELHICTFGARNYAHTVAALLDQTGMLFSHRILSRDECFDPASKTANLKALFPCGDSMVCIIDDREDVWQGCGNLVQVKPYHFFRHTGDIHAPPGLAKQDKSSQVSKVDVENKKTENGTSMPKDQENSQLVDSNERRDEKANTKPMDEDSTVTQKITLAETPDANNKIDNPEKASKMSDESPKIEEINMSESVELSLEKDKLEAEVKEVGSISETAETQHRKKTTEVADKETEQEDFKEMEKRQEEEDHDDYLLYLEDILRRIHAEFYSDGNGNSPSSADRKSLRDIIPRVRSRVLKGLRLTFSGMVATHQKLHQSRAYKLARALGSEVFQDLTENTTHLVAVKPGTAKVNAAKRTPKMKIVNPDWLWTCAERWEHVDERLYPLTKQARGSRVPPPHCSSPERAGEQETFESDTFADSINPLMSFTSEEIANMDKEVEEDMSEPEPDAVPSAADIVLFQPKRHHHRSRSLDIINGGECDTYGNKRRKIADDESSSEDKKDSNAEDEDKDGNENDDDDDDDDEDGDFDLMERFRQGEDLPDDLDLGDDSRESTEVIANDDDGEWSLMGAALERGFLSE